jgi:hypothetical protein
MIMANKEQGIELLRARGGLKFSDLEKGEGA